jgi:hypothetical protein
LNYSKFEILIRQPAKLVDFIGFFENAKMIGAKCPLRLYPLNSLDLSLNDFVSIKLNDLQEGVSTFGVQGLSKKSTTRVSSSFGSRRLETKIHLSTREVI